MEENKIDEKTEKNEEEITELNSNLNLVIPVLNPIFIQPNSNLLPLLFNNKKDKNKEDFIKEFSRQDYDKQKMQGFINKKINIQPINLKFKEPASEKHSEKESDNTSTTKQTGFSLK